MSTKVAIIGTGWGTNVQVPIFRQVGLEIAALWARSQEKARNVAAELSIPFGSTDYEAVINQPGVELVSITTPPGPHAQMTAAALEAGKHVLCEKPTALNAAEAELMLSHAQAHPDRVTLIDHELRFLPALQKMRALIGEGFIGEVYSFSGTSWDEWAIGPNIRWHWWHDSEAGGGSLGAVGSHLLDTATFVLDQPVEAVSGDLHTFIREQADSSGAKRPVTSDDFFTLRLRFGGGVKGLLQSNGISPGLSIFHLIAVGSDGTLIFDGSQLLSHRINSSEPEVIETANELTIPNGLSDSVWVRGTILLATALRTAIETGDHSALSPAASFTDGLHVQHVLDAARGSHDTGSWIELI